MASSFVPNSNIKSGFTVMTQVVPGGPGQTGVSASTPGPVQKLLKRENKALGTAQIVIGIMTLLFGIVSTVRLEAFFVYAYVTLWGPAFFIISGVLSVVAGFKAYPSLVTVSLVMNVISSVIAGVAIVLLSISLISFRPVDLCYEISYRGPYHHGAYETKKECKSLKPVLRMASSFVPNSNIKSGFTVMTQVVPGGPGQTGVSASTPISIQKLLKRENKALGTAQIVIGIMTLLFGIVSTVRLESFFVYSYVTLWGPAFFIISGVLSVVAGIKAHPSLVTVSLVMNVISSVIAGVVIVLLSISLIFFHPDYLCHDNSYRESYHRGEYDTEQECKSLQELAYGFGVVLLILAVLECLISICSSAFICRSSCSSEVTVYLHNNSQTNNEFEENV
ncbi:uncharacterized protein [Hoplias malabaricus]|uniref:uncharacterized protein n=1 Tax=Hoplias malabaricus TaxID=27720 RepID=UPI0034636534